MGDGDEEIVCPYISPLEGKGLERGFGCYCRIAFCA
jgi:hypothetical protein